MASGSSSHSSPASPGPGDGQVRNARGDRLLDDSVDRRPVDHGQHLLRLLLRKRQESRAQTSGGDDGLHDTRLSLSALPPILAAASRFHPLIP